jgi:hypothetical protein
MLRNIIYTILISVIVLPVVIGCQGSEAEKTQAPGTGPKETSPPSGDRPDIE